VKYRLFVSITGPILPGLRRQFPEAVLNAGSDGYYSRISIIIQKHCSLVMNKR